ncbi:hypothetical protein ACIP79_28490 [Streptomyces sp. NPDC088747]|uniref:hypothetical protein n=1 Tax=Streptomyces sp. NPDC088747 TaxID=3365886 RepID=UPI003815B2AB
MSDNYLTVIPTDPYWQPSKDAADRAAAVLSGMLPDDDAHHGLEAKWHDSVEVVFRGAHLEKIFCPRCGAAFPPSWWGKPSRSATTKPDAARLAHRNPIALGIPVLPPRPTEPLALGDQDEFPVWSVT